MRRVFGRLGGFATSSALSGVAALAVVPVLVQAVGALQWSAVAVGQSIGGIAAIVLGLGWGVSGAATVASGTAEAASAALRDSLVTRAVLLPPLAATAAAVSWLVAPAAPLASALTAVAFTSLGSTSNWFYIGRGDPRRLMLFETAPRAAGSLLGAVLVLALGSAFLLVYPLLTLAGVLVAAGLTARLTSRHSSGPVLATVRRTLRKQRVAALTGVVSASYLNLPVVAVALLAPSQTPVIALADRLFRFANAGLAPVNQTLQSWIPHSDTARLRERIRRGRRIAIGVAAVAALLFGVLALPAGRLLSAGTIELPLAVVLAFAGTLAFTTVSQTVGVACLSSLGAVRSVAASAVAGAVLGVAVLIPATATLGAAGAAWAESGAEGAVALYQLLALRMRLRDHRPVARPR